MRLPTGTGDLEMLKGGGDTAVEMLREIRDELRIVRSEMRGLRSETVERFGLVESALLDVVECLSIVAGHVDRLDLKRARD